MPAAFKYSTSLAAGGDTTLAELIDDMQAIGAQRMEVAISNQHCDVVTGLVVLHGPHASRYLDAINAIAQQLEQEHDQ